MKTFKFTRKQCESLAEKLGGDFYNASAWDYLENGAKARWILNRPFREKELFATLEEAYMKMDYQVDNYLV